MTFTVKEQRLLLEGLLCLAAIDGPQGDAAFKLYRRIQRSEAPQEPASVKGPSEAAP